MRPTPKSYGSRGPPGPDRRLRCTPVEGTTADRGVRGDDSLHPVTRALLWVVVVLALLAGVELFVLTDHTERFFAWTIDPPLTAAFLGAAYWSASVMAFLSVRPGRWSAARPMVVGILAVTPLLLVVTLVHLAIFRMDSVYGIVWLIVYASLPVLTPVAVALQVRRTTWRPATVPIPRAVVVLIVLLAAGLVAIGLTLLVAPSAAERFWAWRLAPLSARAVGAWFVAYGVTAAWIAWERDLVRSAAPAVAYAVFGMLGLAALLRYSGSVDWGSSRTWVLVAALALSAAGGGIVAALAVRERRRGGVPEPEAPTTAGGP